MKVIDASEMMRVEKKAYEKGAKASEYMQKAGAQVAEVVQIYVAKHHLKPKIVVLVGKGNNGGDALVAARLLSEGSFHVTVLCLSKASDSSEMTQEELKRFVIGKGSLNYVKSREEINFSDAELIVDGIFGIGFKGEVTGLYREAIEKANSSHLPIISIDIPSGIDGDEGKKQECVIHAQATVALGAIKSGLFLSGAYNHVGRIFVRSFGMPSEYIDEAKASFCAIDEEELTLSPLIRNRHKYDAGYVVGWAGSKEMPGAAHLTSLAALRAGCGIVRLLHPEDMSSSFSPHEIIRESYQDGEKEKIIANLKLASSNFIGPGLGRSEKIRDLIEQIVPALEKPLVIDADALFHLSTLKINFPKETILTPHVGEMLRLLGLKEPIEQKELLKRCQAYAQEKQVTLLLKGAPTFIFHPTEQAKVMIRGTPGMATAGSGDVLTGMIASLLAQGKKPLQAASEAALLHALAGEMAAEKKSDIAMIASDIIEELPQLFLKLKASF